MNPEDLLREAMQRSAEAVDPAPGWDRIEAGIARRQWWRRIVPPVATVATLATVASLTFVVARPEPAAEVVEQVGPAAPGPEATTSSLPDVTTTQPAPTSTAAGGAAPPSSPPSTAPSPPLPSIFAAADDGKVVELEATTGKRIRTVIDARAELKLNGDAGWDAFGVDNVSVSPDGKTVWIAGVFDSYDNCKTTAFRLVPGPRVTIDPGAGPAVTWDGRRLAVMTWIGDSCFESQEEPTPVIRIVDAKRPDAAPIREIELPIDVTESNVEAMAWAPDGRHLAYTVSGADVDASHTSWFTYVIDTQADDPIGQRVRMLDEARHPAFDHRGRLFVAQHCCAADGWEHARQIVEVNPSTGRAVDVVEKTSPDSLDVDPSGTLLLIGEGAGYRIWRIGTPLDQARWVEADGYADFAW